MKILLFVSLALTAGWVDCGVLPNTGNPSLIYGINKFSHELMKKHLEEKEAQNGTSTDNFVMSQFCAFMPLFILCRGAEGDTKLQLDQVMNTQCSNSSIKDEYINLFSQFNDVKTATVKLASALFLANTHQLKPEFKENEREILSLIKVQESMNFGQNENSAKIINDWIKENTNNTLSDVVKPDELSENTVIALANTLYFKGKWEENFEPENTHDEIFTNVKGEQKNVSFMYQEKDYVIGYISDLQSHFYDMLLEGGEYSFVIFVPENNSSLGNLEKKLGGFNMITFLKNADYILGHPVNYSRAGYVKHEFLKFHLPKFNVTSTIPLKNYLSKMGLKHLMEDNGNLVNMIGDELMFSEAKQDVRIEVNEFGVSAAAVTVYIGFKSARITTESREVKINNPFAYVILHRDTGMNLFTGSVRSL